MTCSSCGRPCDVIEHRIRVDGRLLIYDAPLYHFVDYRTMDGEPFCSSRCASDPRDAGIVTAMGANCNGNAR